MATKILSRACAPVIEIIEIIIIMVHRGGHFSCDTGPFLEGRAEPKHLQ